MAGSPFPGPGWFNGGVVGIQLIAVHHADHGLGAVETIAQGVPGLGQRLLDQSPDAVGTLVLSTCNRVEVYAASDAPERDLSQPVCRAAGVSWPGSGTPLTHLEGIDAIDHLFRVTAGLDSMVVGDREVAAQVRLALRDAQHEGTASGLLLSAAEPALRTPRQVTHLTHLASRGRSVVSVALDLLRRDWTRTRVLLVGTGAYAGAVVADLGTRDCRDIVVHSGNGRAEFFAETHAGVRPASTLDAELTVADVVITCRGSGVLALTVGDVEAAMVQRHGRDLVLVDLAVTRDVDPACADLPGVLHLDLDTVSRHVPEASRRDVVHADELVNAGVAETLERLRGREMDPAVIALRDTVHDMVADEVDRLPLGRPLTRDEAAHALRRLAARLVHVPSVRARKAAVEGRTDEYLTALSELWGLEPQRRPVLDRLDLDVAALVGEGPPENLDDDSCPVTGLTLGDLGDPPLREAM